MPTEEIQTIKLDVQKNKLDIKNIVDRIDSYHFDHKIKLEKVETKIDSLPSEDRIFRMFKEEGEKLAKGLIKQIDEVKLDVKLQGVSISEQKDSIKDINKEISFAKRQGYIFASLATGAMVTIGWLIDFKDKIKHFFISDV